MVSVGLTLQPDEAFLDLLGEVIEREVDHYEVAPETLWRFGDRGELVENGYFRRFTRLAEEGRAPFVAHGVGFSLGTVSVEDDPRRRRWIARLNEFYAEQFEAFVERALGP